MEILIQTKSPPRNFYDMPIYLFHHLYMHNSYHDDVIKWKHFPRYWPYGGEFTGVRPTQRPMTRSFEMFSLICSWINRWVNNGEAGDLRRYRAHYDVIVMTAFIKWYGLHFHFIRNVRSVETTYSIEFTYINASRATFCSPLTTLSTQNASKLFCQRVSI